MVARGGRERSNPAETTTTARDGRKGDPQLNVVGKMDGQRPAATEIRELSEFMFPKSKILTA